MISRMIKASLSGARVLRMGKDKADDFPEAEQVTVPSRNNRSGQNGHENEIRIYSDVQGATLGTVAL